MTPRTLDRTRVRDYGDELDPKEAAVQDTSDSPRLFVCARCRAPATVCRHCDRGQRYCSLECSREARAKSSREAGRSYQRSAEGRAKNAARQRAYRERQKALRQQAVTHQRVRTRAKAASPPTASSSALSRSARPSARTTRSSGPLCFVHLHTCVTCASPVHEAVRHDSLRPGRSRCRRSASRGDEAMTKKRHRRVRHRNPALFRHR